MAGNRRGSKLAGGSVKRVFNADDLTLRIEAVGLEKLPAFDRFAETVPPVTTVTDFLGRPTPQVAPANVLLTHDFFGRKRLAAQSGSAPLDPPLDGTAFKIDPRKLV